MTLRGTNHMPIFRVSLDLCMIAAIVLLLAAGHGCNGFVSHRASLISKRSGIMPQEAPVSSRLRSRIPSGKITANAEERDILRPATATRMSANEEVSPGFVEQFTKGWQSVVPVGDPDSLPACPSGVSSMSKPAQAAVFASVFAALGAGTAGLLAGLPVLEAALPDGWYSAWQGTWPVPLGLIFAAAGVAHFTTLEGFCNIYPGRGAWGFWYLPGTASFHVKWTGVAEIAGGVGLALGGLGVGPPGLMQASAAGLVALTLAVTPANIYMFTHGAQFPVGVEVPVVGHAIRGVFQCILLAFFYVLATQ